MSITAGEGSCHDAVVELFEETGLLMPMRFINPVPAMLLPAGQVATA
jgi:hypothetical protein